MVFMDKIGPNHVGMMVINAMVGQGDHVMSMRLWPLTRSHFDNGLLLPEVEKFLCENPSSESKEEVLNGVKKTPIATPLKKN